MTTLNNESYCVQIFTIDTEQHSSTHISECYDWSKHDCAED